MALKKNSGISQPLVDIRHSDRDLPGLMMQLNDSDPEIRRWAAKDLTQFPEAATSLCQRLEIESNQPTREMIATALIHIGSPQVVSGLVPLLRSDDAALRNTVIEALKQLPAAVAPYMEQLLDDADPDVRIFVVNVLEALQHPKVEDWLIAVISTDPHINVVATALDLLGEVGTEASLPALYAVSQRFASEPFIAFAVHHAVQRIRSE